MSEVKNKIGEMKGWEIHPNNEFNINVSDGVDIEVWYSTGNHEEAKAVTKLVCAAPDMLEALIELTKRTAHYGAFADADENGKAHLKAIEAIKKATS